MKRTVATKHLVQNRNRRVSFFSLSLSLSLSFFLGGLRWRFSCDRKVSIIFSCIDRWRSFVQQSNLENLVTLRIPFTVYHFNALLLSVVYIRPTVCVYLYMYMCIYIYISVYVCIYIKSLWTVLLLKYLYRMYTYTIYFFSPLYTHMYICDLFGWHRDRVWSLIRCFRRFCFFCFKNLLHPTNINFPTTLTHPRSEMEWNKTRGPRLGCVNGYTAYTGR